MEFLQYALIAVAIIVIYYGDKILSRIPPNTPNASILPPDTGDRFVVWMEVESFWLDEYEIGHIDDWTNGHKFTAVGPASFEPKIDIDRASFKFSSSPAALAANKVIGYGRKPERSVVLYIDVTPNVARDLLDEIRRNPKSQIHAQGYTNEKGAIKITYVLFTPSILG